MCVSLIVLKLPALVHCCLDLFFYRFWILCTGTKGERKILLRIKQTNMHIWWSSLTRRYSACGLMSTAGWTVSKLVDDFKGCLSVLFVVFFLGQPCHFCRDPITSTCDMSVSAHDSYFGSVTEKRLNHKCAHMILRLISWGNFSFFSPQRSMTDFAIQVYFMLPDIFFYLFFYHWCETLCREKTQILWGINIFQRRWK